MNQEDTAEFKAGYEIRIKLGNTAPYIDRDWYFESYAAKGPDYKAGFQQAGNEIQTLNFLTGENNEETE